MYIAYYYYYYYYYYHQSTVTRQEHKVLTPKEPFSHANTSTKIPPTSADRSPAANPAPIRNFRFATSSFSKITHGSS
jgi:hypothetical protein